MTVDLPADVSINYACQYRRCGKASCRTCRDGALGHGPYWYAFWDEQGRRRSRYLGKQPPAGIPDRASGPARTCIPMPEPEGATPTLRVRTLGGFQVWRGEQPVPARAWNRRKAASLFKCLLGADGYRLHREWAIELLWPNVAPAAAARNLRFTIHLLRRLLMTPGTDGSYLSVESAMLVLTPDPRGGQAADWLDAAVFARAARVALTGQEPAACRAALDLYQGEYLPDERYADWAAARRDELRSLHLAVLLHLADICIARGAAIEAVPALRAILAIHHCHEAAACTLMGVLAAGGARAEAIQVYRSLATALREELDAAPGQEIQACYAQILAHPTNLPVPATSFIGRQHEKAAIADLLATTRLLTLMGVGGCGKTRLALAVAADLLSDHQDGVWLADMVARGLGDYSRATARCEECLALFRRLKDTQSVARQLGNLGAVAQEQGDLDRARTLQTECLAIYRSLADAWGIAASLVNLGFVAKDQDDYQRGASLLGEGMLALWRLGDRLAVVDCLVALAIVAVATGLIEHAARLIGAEATLRDKLGIGLSAPQQAERAGVLAAITSSLNEEAYAHAWAQGRDMLQQELIAELVDPVCQV